MLSRRARSYAGRGARLHNKLQCLFRECHLTIEWNRTFTALAEFFSASPHLAACVESLRLTLPYIVKDAPRSYHSPILLPDLASFIDSLPAMKSMEFDGVFREMGEVDESPCKIRLLIQITTARQPSKFSLCSKTKLSSWRSRKVALVVANLPLTTRRRSPPKASPALPNLIRP